MSFPRVRDGESATSCEVVFVFHETLTTRTKTIYGEDEIQALLLSFKFVRNELLNLPYDLHCDGLIVEEIFPKFIDPYLGKFSRTMETYVENRMEDFNTRRHARLEARHKRKSR